MLADELIRVDGPVNVLVVDDERVNLTILSGILKDQDLNIMSASSGEEALALARENDFAVALLDVMMPGLDGFQTAEKLRSLEPLCALPIIFVTAISKEQKHVFRGYELGAVDYLFKPVEPEVLQAKVGVFIDLYRQRKALALAQQRYQTIAEYTYDWELWLSPEDEILFMSPSCKRISGYGVEDFQDDPGLLKRIIMPGDREAWDGFMKDNQRDTGDSLDFRIQRRDGAEVWISQVKYHVRNGDGTSLGLRCSLRDITQRKAMEIQLRHQALHDPLTQLANRTLLLERISHALQRAKRQPDYHYCVVFMDLDRFKVVNDSLGHSFGDKLLYEVSRRLLTCVRTSDTVSRFGGDEFVFFLEDTGSAKEVFAIIKRVLNAMREPFQIGDHEMQTTVSLGVVMDQEDADSAEDLIQKSNIAMYKAKEAGRDRYHVFNERMLEQAVRQMHLENDLRRALANQEFFVVYQPIVRLEDQALVGFEALCRWQHPVEGVISPGEFIPVAEESGLIIDIGRLVLRQACATVAGWAKKVPGAEDLVISVNLSGRQFRQKDLTGDIKRVLNETGLPPNRLKLELTETTVMDDVQVSTAKLKELKEHGVTLAIDDFGTGYSSLNYLQKLPLDQLKVDLSFVRRMDEGPENVEIVRAIISLAHVLGMVAVAEGIERVEQRDLLANMECGYGQGYLFAKPLSTEDALEFVRASATADGGIG